MLVLNKLVTLSATIVLAPSLSFVVFDMLTSDTFAPGQTLSGLIEWQKELLLHGSLGYDLYYDSKLTLVLFNGLPVDLTMMCGGLAFGLVGGVAGGLAAVARPRSLARRGMDLLAGLGVSMPVYWMGFAVLMLFASNTGMIVQLPFVSGAAEYREMIRAFANGDVTLIQALIVQGCVIIALANTATDLLQARLDPRVRESMSNSRRPLR